AFSIESTSLQKDFIFFTSTGCMKKSGLDKFSTNYSKIMALKLKDDEKIASVKLVDVEREEAFIKFTTELGMEFTLEEPVLESADRNIASLELITTSSGNRIIDAELTDVYNYRNFFVNIGKDGMVRTADSKDSKSSFTEVCTSSSRLLMFQDDGIVLSIPAFMIQNVGERGVEISKIFDGIDFRRIMKAVCIDDFSADKYFCFISAKGIVKKTALNEFQGDAMTSTACKFKTENDSLVGVELAGNDYDLLIITKKGMSILFSIDSVNTMGRIASGVTAISLGEDDQVIYELVAESITDKPGSIKMTSKKGLEAEMKLADFRRQNRAGKGRNICLIVFEDFIKDIKYKSR
ncbi:MAG TPA: DNA gyrase C-terminal beta-propeller domain-containing protein, partial [Clostridiaceae bacterium]